MVFSQRAAAVAAVTSALCSGVLAIPTAPVFNNLLGIPSEDAEVPGWASIGRLTAPEYVTVERHQLGNGTHSAPAPSEVIATAGRMITSRGVIDTEDREDWADLSFPYSAMGKIQWSSGVWCSGSLVGPRHVATAKHCVPESGSGISVRFMPGYYEGERFPGANVETVITMPGYSVNDNPDSCDWKEDWAIFILDARLGEAQGWLGATTPSEDQMNKSVFWNYGFPGDKGGEKAYVSDASLIYDSTSCDAYGPYLTDTDVVGGQSGGPFWIPDGNWYQYAICSGTSATNSIFSGGNNWVNAVIQSRIDFP